MKKYLQSTWMRILSCVLCALSALSFVVCAIGFYLGVQFTDTTDAYEIGCHFQEAYNGEAGILLLPEALQD